ncbi:MAG: PTS sugar transporter subunit IIB [Deltaproteobacteria bacterium]|jgi:mannose/fructose/N-acetylgalactosamine-specific phosphotransferase system component IIB|nr:PTS sugar transporter subunit IIB [Deltaproteobacteria bacterium]
MPIVLARIDQRIVHGQVASSPALEDFHVNGVIIADKALSEDAAQKLIFNATLKASNVSLNLGIHYLTPEGVFSFLTEFDSPKARYLALFRDIKGALSAINAGLKLTALNLGNYVSACQSKTALRNCFKVGPEELKELDILSHQVSKLYFGSLDSMHNSSALYKPASLSKSLTEGS